MVSFICIRMLFNKSRSSAGRCRSADKMLIEWLCIVRHLILHGGRHKIWITLTAFNGALCRVTHIARNCRLWRQHSTILNYTTVLQSATTALETINNNKDNWTLQIYKLATYNNSIFADVYKWANKRRWYHSTLANEDMVPNVHGKESDTFAELLVRWSDHWIFAYHTIAPSANICQVSTYNGAALNNNLAIEHYVLGATEHRVTTHFVARGL